MLPYLPTSHRSILLSLLFLSSSTSLLLLLRSLLRRRPRTLPAHGFEMGGTSCKVASGLKHFNSKGQLIKVEILQKHVIPSANLTPSETIRRLVEFVKELQFDDVGVAHFGPLCLDEKSEDFGRVTSTPKKMWQGFDSLGEFRKLLGGKGRRFVIETDVNAAAMAEFQMGIYLYLENVYLPPPSSLLLPPSSLLPPLSSLLPPLSSLLTPPSSLRCSQWIFFNR